jgi:hypothetical protein
MSSIHKQTKPNEKHPKFGNLPLSTSGPLDCALVGSALCNTPHFNKGAGFTARERKEFKLTSLLPQNIQSLEQQVKRAYQQYSSRPNDLAKNTFMTSLKEQNEVLFYKVSILLLKLLATKYSACLFLLMQVPFLGSTTSLTVFSHGLDKRGIIVAVVSWVF